MLSRSLLALFVLVGCATATDASTRIDRALYPEGPLWHEGRLYVAEMGGDRVSVFADGRKSTFFARSGCGPTALAPYGQGFLILCHVEGVIVAVDRDARVLFTRDADSEGHLFRDPNDCFADGEGGVYFSDPGLFSKRTPPQGALMHIDAAGVVRRVADNLWYPNGVYVDVAHRTLFLSETFRRRVLRYVIAADGALGPMSVFADLDRDAPAADRYETAYAEAGPDGLEMGPDGLLYVAMYGEGRILRLGRDGRALDAIEEGPRYVTNITFAPSGDAYVTGAFNNVDRPYPGEVRRHSASELGTAR